mgnify:CR=1 FL=1
MLASRILLAKQKQFGMDNVILSRKNSFAQPSKLGVIDYKEISDSHELSNGFSKH